ncbi:MAG: MBL fold metallo-hydrolase [Phycisphaerales bacterium JB052]
MARSSTNQRSSRDSQGRTRLSRTMRAMRSGFRRYPRAIYDSVRQPGNMHAFVDIPEALHHLWPHELAVMWLGHASVVAQVHDVTIGVDPVLNDRIGLRMGRKTIGLPRIAPPPVPPESLRGLDLVLITHAHFDHLDRPTLQSIASSETGIIVPKRCRKLIPKGYAEVIELSPGESLEHAGMRISAIAPAHWGARKVFDRRRGVNAYVVESDTQRVLFTGDTASTSAFDNLESIDLAVFGIGAYDPWEHMHATPEQAWAMFQRVGARYLLPIHHSTYELSEEPIDEPMNRLRAAAGDAFDASVIVPTEGEVVVINEGPPTDA